MVRILHIGSHVGNIGDNASHAVVREALASRTRVEFHCLEIRRFYANAAELRFDAGFADQANEYDLVLIGGGNFLEPIHGYASNGTTIDLSREVLDRLRVPVVLNAVAFDPAKGRDEELLDRFRAWVELVARHPRVKVNLRDDGSLDYFTRLVGPPGDFGFGLTPDPGLFYEPRDDFPFTDREYIAVNLAGDLGTIRYPDPKRREDLFASLRSLMAALPEEMALVLVPHVALDVSIIGDFLGDCSDWASRKRVLVAPLLQGYADFWKPFDIYRKASGIIANRFHSLVCNLQYGIPMAVLANYPKIVRTLERMELEELIHSGGEAELIRRLIHGEDPTALRRPRQIRDARAGFDATMDEILEFAGA